MRGFEAGLVLIWVSSTMFALEPVAGGSGGRPARAQDPVQGLQRARRDAGLPEPALPPQLPPGLREAVQVLPEGAHFRFFTKIGT